MHANSKDCIILVPVSHAIEPDCDAALRSLEKLGYPVWRCYGFSAIDQGRNVMAQTALDKGYKELMWIDSDVIFQTSDVGLLRKKNLPVSCGIYGLKDGSGRPAADLSNSKIIGVNQLQISLVGAGFLHTRREVYEQIVGKLKLPKCTGRHCSYHPYFLPLVENKQYLGEDFAFCRRLDNCGIKIIADTSLRLAHIGKQRHRWQPDGVTNEPVFAETVPQALATADDIAAITCFFNPAGFKSLRQNFDKFREGVERTSAPLYVAELTRIGGQPTIQHPNLLHLESDDTIWQKESLLNRVVQQIPKRYTKIAFLDCDLLWPNANFLDIASAKLNKVPAVQLFSEITYLDANGGVDKHYDGMIKALKYSSGSTSTPGGAWAVHRELFTHFGGLYSKLITGGGDSVAAELGFLGRSNPKWLQAYNPAVQASITDWAAPVNRYCRGQVDFVDQPISHLYHGAVANRGYWSRREVIRNFDPERDVQLTDAGLLTWSANVDPTIKTGMHQYFVSRQEDC